MGLTFNGSSQSVGVTHHSSLNVSTAFSVVLGTKWASASGDRYALGKGGDIFDMLVYSASHGRMSFYITTTSGGFLLQSTADKNDGAEHLFIATFDSALGSNQQKLYTDGTLDNQQNAAGTMTTDANNMSFGKYGAGNLFYWDGSLFDIRLYDRALTAAEVSLIYQQKGSDLIESGLISRWKMRELKDGSTATGSGTILDTKSVNPGTQVNGPLYYNDRHVYDRRRIPIIN